MRTSVEAQNLRRLAREGREGAVCGRRIFSWLLLRMKGNFLAAVRECVCVCVRV